MLSPVWATLLAVLAGLIIKLLTIGRRESGLPPGPPTVPLLGNLHIFPTDFLAVKFSEWARQWGDVYSIKVSSSTMIVLSSAKAVKELIDKRGWVASSRPPNFLIDQINNGQHVAFMPAGPQLTAVRKALTSMLSAQAALKQRPIQEAESAQLLYELITKPQELQMSIRRYTHSVTKTAVYGKRVPYANSPESIAYMKAQDSIDAVLNPTRHPPIDLLPFLKYLPDSWAPWMAETKEVRRLHDTLHLKLMAECEERLARGSEPNSFLEEVIQSKILDGNTDRYGISSMGLIVLEGGTDTSSAFLQSFVLALVCHPELQRKAQQEVDALISEDRLPTIEDYEKLPYVNALVKEVLRYRPILPLAVPHYMTQDEHYRGYLIPKDATVFINTFGLFHDPEVFDDPESLNPERYLASEHGTKPGVDASDFRDTIVFGAGRRICPGIHVAKYTMYLTAMRLLWAFDFSPAIDESTGKPIILDMPNMYRSDFTMSPKEFQCAVKPRSPARAKVIQNAFADATNAFLPYEEMLPAEDKEALQQQRSSA